MQTNFEKVYTKDEILKIVKDNNYKFICLEDLNGNKIARYNSVKVKESINDNLKAVFKRLDNEIVPTGFYYICLAYTITQAKNPDKFLISKGTPDKSTLSQAPIINNPTGLQINSKNDLISISAALTYISEIAELKNKLFVAETENKNLKNEIAVLEAELSEYESQEESGLNDKPSDTLTYLKETAPSLMALADRYFEQQDKKLEVEKLKILNQAPKKRSIKTFDIGSFEHLNLIRSLVNANKENEYNAELDKLENEKPEIYSQICKELNINTDETGN